VRAAWSEGAYLPPYDYDLDGTPCAEVLARGMCHYPTGVADQFPRDQMLAEMGIESYAGFRVMKRGASATGIIIGLHDRATEIVTPELAAVLELFAERAAVELEREAFEAELRASESRYRQIVTTCAEGVWTIDVEGRTTFVNDQMASMLGYEAAEMQGRPFFDFMDEAGRLLASAKLERRLHGVREIHEFRLKMKDGTDLWTIMATSPLRDDAGTVVGALALVSDVTQRRKLEERIQQSQKLESLGLLAGGIAHDFNNLLVGILGNTGIALRDLPHESPVLPALGDIRDSALRLADLTKQMLAYSGRGRFVVEPARGQSPRRGDRPPARRGRLQEGGASIPFRAEPAIRHG
jgi:PAS domain S-box-containing protein